MERDTFWDKAEVLNQAELIINEHAKKFREISGMEDQILNPQRPFKEKISGKFNRRMRILLVGVLLLGTPGLLGLLHKPDVGRTDVEQTYWPDRFNRPIAAALPTPDS